MTRIVFAAALALAVSLPAVSAQAQAPRTFVSAAGSDSNPCSFAAPCRHFQTAVNATIEGGEVDALDPAGYGPITIRLAITIEGQGWSYIAPPPNGAAITIGASGNVVIHGVSLNGVGITGTTTGIQFNSNGPGASLIVRDSVIQNMTGDGIHFAPPGPGGTSPQSISVSNTSVGNNAGNGILVQPQAMMSATAMFERVVTQYNGSYGIALDATLTTAGTVSGTATDSVSSNNGGGFLAQGGQTGGHAILTMVRSVAANNHTGVQGSTGSREDMPGVVRVGQSTITNNHIACNLITYTFGDNYISDNGTDNCNTNPILKE